MSSSFSSMVAVADVLRLGRTGAAAITSSIAVAASSSIAGGSGRGSYDPRHGHCPIDYLPKLLSSTLPPAATSSSIIGCGKDEVDDKCSLAVIGLNMATAPATVRGRLTLISTDEYRSGVRQFHEFPSIREFFLLTTAGRFELYAMMQPISSLGAVQEAIVAWLSKESGLPASELNQHVILHRDVKAARYFFEALVSDAIHRGNKFFFREWKSWSQYSKFCVCGLVLSDLLAKAFFIQMRINLSAEVSISSAALAVVRAELRGTKSIPNALVVGVNTRHCIHFAIDLVCRLKLVPKNVVVVRRESEHDEHDELDDDIQMQGEACGITFRPMSELLSSASEANLIFITSSSEPPMLSRTLIDRLPPPTIVDHAEDGHGGSRILVDMCYPPNIISTTPQGAIKSVRVFNIEHLFKVIQRQESNFWKEINEDVEDFESWMEEALGGGRAMNVAPLPESLLDDAVERNYGRTSSLTNSLDKLL